MNQFTSILIFPYSSSLLAALLVWLLVSSQAWANQPLSGCFVAKQNCEALHSIRKQTNLGKIQLEQGKQYAVKGKNKTAATHYLLEIEGVKNNRWVAVQCGDYSENCSMSSMAASNPSASTGTNDKEPEYLLALSWQPAFCESHKDKAECKTLSDKRYDATHLAIHGLWPQPRNNAYCDVSQKDKSIDRRKRWDLLQPLKLSDQTRLALAKTMPGYTSNLHRHEWIKHGTCFGASAEDYYRTTILLANIFNQSAVQEVLAENIDKKVSRGQIQKAFDKSFGDAVGEKVKVSCDRKGRLGELFIPLKGSLTSLLEADEKEQIERVKALLKAASPQSGGCKGGVVDPA